MKSNRCRLVGITCVLFLALLATACGRGAKEMPKIPEIPVPPQPIPISGQIIAAPDVNPDLNNRPSPLVVRIYHLRTAGGFEAADFFSLFESDRAVLGAELVSREELELQPGSSRSYSVEAAPGTRYLGVVAAYRNLEEAQWRGGINIPEKAEQLRVQIRLEHLAVSVSVLD